MLLRIHAGDRDIGYLYNFSYRGAIMVYQSGLNYKLVDTRHNPGLTAHALAIQFSADSGFDTYDFLGGATRYKRQLATAVASETSVFVEKGTWPQQIEHQWRKWKKRLTQRRQASDTGKTAANSARGLVDAGQIAVEATP
jgi:hypothetical protein